MKRLEKHQTEALRLAFQESNHLTKAKKIELAAATGLAVELIAYWFNRKRTRKQVQELMAEKQAHFMLQNALRISQERAEELQSKLEESKRREAELQAEHEHLKQCLVIAEGGIGNFKSNGS